MTWYAAISEGGGGYFEASNGQISVFCVGAKL